MPAALSRTQDIARGIKGAGNEVIAVAWRAQVLANKFCEEVHGEPAVVCEEVMIALARCGRFALEQIRANISKETVLKATGITPSGRVASPCEMRERNRDRLQRQASKRSRNAATCLPTGERS